MPESRQPQDRTSSTIGELARPVTEIIHADHRIDEAVLRLSLQKRPVLPVVDGDEIIGVLTRHDVPRAREASEPAHVTARELMNAALPFCYLDDGPMIAHALMERHACEYLLAVDRGGNLKGVLGREDLPLANHEEVRLVRRQLEALGSREADARGMASTTNPGGLEVYAQQPTIKHIPGG
jgi:CBS domain-containing protein